MKIILPAFLFLPASFLISHSVGAVALASFTPHCDFFKEGKTCITNCYDAPSNDPVPTPACQEEKPCAGGTTKTSLFESKATLLRVAGSSTKDYPGMTCKREPDDQGPKVCRDAGGNQICKGDPNGP